MDGINPLLAFALTALIIEITPGPNMAYLAALSLSRGWRIGLAAVAGVALGLSVYGIAAALGVAAIIESSTLLYQALRWGGVIYLLWLAFNAWSSADDVASEGKPGHDHTRASAFRRGLITNLLNPKAEVFYVAVLPEFQVRSIGSRLIHEGLAMCRQAGYDAVVVLGDPAYYSSFGFRRAADFGLQNEYARS